MPTPIDLSLPPPRLAPAARFPSAREVPVPPSHEPGLPEAMTRLWAAVDTFRRTFSQRCAHLGQHLLDACTAFGQDPLPDLPRGAPNLAALTHAIGMGIAVPYTPRVRVALAPQRYARGTHAPPGTPPQRPANMLRESFLQLEAIDADRCGPGAICPLTLEPLEELTEPVAACHKAVVQVYEFSALQEFWRTFPERSNTTPNYMPITSLLRVVARKSVPPADGPKSVGAQCPRGSDDVCDLRQDVVL